MRVHTIGHGTRPAAELVAALSEAGVGTLIDVRRYARSRRNPQYDERAVAAAVEQAGIRYLHAEELGGRRSGEPGEQRFACIRVPAFRSYAARMGSDEWQRALAEALVQPAPCFMCAETLWTRCHRRLIAELLVARGHEVLHLLDRGRRERHRLFADSDLRDGTLFLCGTLVA